ncbi:MULTISPECIES: diaminopimelate decarboxylase [Cycloclasticus]|jgi:diaminopimelate decarboxylase|uniref:Diaminopimelate decarboxylase n=2 Tax=Cycloclasticus TaxID=34067 RepID=S5T4F4_9GAMM|nr:MULTISPECIES: diaminopimelate decarboxylase [Cycloclasticus]AGS38696.1 Diaminopimelate decarboxylase [Cycloclasticus zancles 78-ME]ATI02363.1 diaminopimelate decarboxylase [Cycloclasticus sp. PY97N]EPD12452.1 diaminopimelate decarboxylase [Cycloclasticus pugetii]MDF1829151.1 diaminopimelate decarboxylase [Cycloclasticus pugetii]
MDYFQYQDKQLFAENVSVQSIVEQFSSPTYIYSRATLERHWKAFDQAFEGRPHLICYAVKANSNIAVLNVLARLGSGFDIVSIGELERVLTAGGQPEKIVFSGVGKRHDEIRRALDVGIRCFNVEVSAELDRINEIAGELGHIANISIRVNPDVDAQTHPYISTGLKENKFGLDIETAFMEYQRANALPHLNITGLDCHIGSQLTDVAPFVDALDRVLSLLDRLQGVGIRIDHLDLGGGLGICYRDEQPPLPADYVKALYQKLGDLPYEILLEPGRAIAGNAGILVTKVEYIKPVEGKRFAIVDAAMNDLMRPALYQAWQNIVPVNLTSTAKTACYDIVGPVCETGDFLGKDRELAIEEGDLLAVRSAGAYGFTMSSNYNSRPSAAEVMVDGEQIHLIGARQRLESLWQNEALLPNETEDAGC